MHLDRLKMGFCLNVARFWTGKCGILILSVSDSVEHVAEVLEYPIDLS